MTQSEKDSGLFFSLVLSLHAATMQQLGKQLNPMTGKTQRDLPGAQASIDMLDMLKDKMKGNLAPEEERLLTQVLQELKLNYVDEMNKPDQPAAAHPSPEASGGASEEQHEDRDRRES